MPNNQLLSLCHFELSAPDGKILKRDLHLELGIGQAMLIKGPNGCGKTTLVNALKEMLRKTKLKIELLSQLMNLKSSLPLSLKDVLDISTQDLSEQMILELGLLERHHFDLSWNSASGGEKKRALLTRALLSRPDILILDEPFNHLDTASVAMITLALARLIKEGSLKSLIVVSHPVFLESPDFSGIPIVEVNL